MITGVSDQKIEHSERNQTLSWRITTEEILPPKQFIAGAVAAGIKKQDGRLDLGLIYSAVPCRGTAKFTANVVKAAPVLLCQKHLASSHGQIQAIIVNSGNANACTGERGLKDAERMAELAAEILGFAAHQILVSSTGVIGVALPVERMEAQKETLKGSLTAGGLPSVARAIMTTDTVQKVCTADGEIQGVPVRICGLTKGSGMIHPNLATTLAFVLTDAGISQELLKEALNEACENSYHRISVDGDTSTNDTLALLSNGASGAPYISSRGKDFYSFVEGLTAVCRSLAQQIVRDGEGATKFIEITVLNAPSEEAATRVARSIANSPLVKTAMAGEDANWGRILCAAGYAGVSFDPDRVSISIGDLAVCRNGAGLAFDEARAREILGRREIEISFDMAAGNGESVMWTCDLTKEYIHINADYRT
jgi:glutamate N-acetyltransferase/amino-acid N-acetyltransferase